MALPVDSILSILICVAINAYPPLAIELAKLAQTVPPLDNMLAIQEVFATHGGEKFGEKDNNQDLLTIQRWLSQARSALKLIPDETSMLHVQPSIYELLDTILPPCSMGMRRMVLLSVDGRDTSSTAAEGLGVALERQWAMSDFCTLVPSLLFVRGSVSDAMSQKLSQTCAFVLILLC
ncbi:hypothetical protein GGI16_007943 [Coemansia sp. S142-1]|nr:hypothetical protein GGI16_007943 [Coemansia sp. S142-1]